MADSNIGGQALTNGVLFRNKDWVAIGRREQGEITLEVYPTVKMTGWKGLLNKIPILRGMLFFLMIFIAFAQGLTQKKKWINWRSSGRKIFFLVIVFLILPFLLELLLSPLDYYLEMLFLSSPSSIWASIAEKFASYLLVFLSFSLLMNAFYPTLFAYHGAEHKAIRTYEKGKPLLLETAFTSSRLHPRCGTGFFALIAILDSFLLTPVLTYYQLDYTVWIQLFLIGLGYEVMLYLRKHCFLGNLFLPLTLLLQRFTTKEPSGEQLEVALAALGALPKG